jgi:hypothetical protein
MVQAIFERQKAEIVARLDIQEATIAKSRDEFRSRFHIPNKLIAVQRTREQNLNVLSQIDPKFKTKPRGRAYGKKG